MLVLILLITCRLIDLCLLPWMCVIAITSNDLLCLLGIFTTKPCATTTIKQVFRPHQFAAVNSDLYIVKLIGLFAFAIFHLDMPAILFGLGRRATFVTVSTLRT